MVEATRPATASDRAEYERLRDEFLSALAGERGASQAPDPGWRAPGSHAAALGRFDALLADRSAIVVFGTLDGVVTGFAQGHLEVATTGVATVRRAVLDACYVEPDARGMGLGRLLLDALVAWAGDKDCDGIDGAALPGDRAAKNFFEAAGFKARMLTMYRPRTDPGLTRD